MHGPTLRQKKVLAALPDVFRSGDINAADRSVVYSAFRNKGWVTVEDDMRYVSFPEMNRYVYRLTTHGKRDRAAFQKELGLQLCNVTH